MPKKLNIGGQAVIEGIMIRGPKYNVVAVRKNKKIITKKEKIKQRKGRFYKLPIVRGFFNLIDMLVLGMRSIMWSAEQQIATEKEEKISKWEMAFTIVFAVSLALLLFLALPYFLTLIIGFKEETQPFFFNLIDGIIRIGMFLLYIYAISLMKDVKVLFRYHGAEHKAVHCYEKGEKLDVKNMKKYSTLHPRCGTAFIMIVLVISILVFSILTPIVLYLFPNLANMHIFPRKTILFLIRFSLLPLIAGISYEFLKLSAKYEKNAVMKMFIWPGLLMQKVTTKKPNKKQIEVAIAAVKNVLQLEKSKNI
jgi:uncharacterized protein YqhQ|tara:strand:+ start:32716 stop:33639 length:924 start_codon:yes stop_codon:yes gene_type:complete